MLAPISRSPGSFSHLIPWIFLGLIFWIPGLYLEWPSDPWEHLRRINEWHGLDTVTAHSAWRKSSYLLAYSLTGFSSGLSQLPWLNVFYTGTCLLLCWQHYRLARAIGLDARASFLFVLLNVMVFGNNIFSFYRYYGLSSSVIAQLAAVALMRIALEAGQGILVSNPLGRPSLNMLRIAPTVLALGMLAAFNHPQALGIAIIGALGVAVWLTLTRRRRAFFWLAGGIVAANIIFLLLHQPSPHIEALRSAGWLNSIYGFNLYAWPSLAAERVWVILGGFGLINLAAGLLLATRNSVAGWLTIIPVVVLSMPVFSVPFASQTEPEEVLVFHRMLFAVPVGLATIVLLRPPEPLAGPGRHTLWPWWAQRLVPGLTPVSFAFPATIGALLYCLGACQSGRAWQLLSREPDDLKLAPAWELAADYGRATRDSPPRHVIATAIPGTVVECMHLGHPVQSGRYNRTGLNVISDLDNITAILGRDDLVATSGAIVVDPLTLFSSGSQTALLARHWAPQDVYLMVAGSAELSRMLTARGYTAHPTAQGMIFLPPLKPSH